MKTSLSPISTHDLATGQSIGVIDDRALLITRTLHTHTHTHTDRETETDRQTPYLIPLHRPYTSRRGAVIENPCLEPALLYLHRLLAVGGAAFPAKTR
jgi:hypothetical protein